MPIQPKTVKTYTPSQIYGDAGLIYIRYHGKIEAKPGGQKKIGGGRPAFSKIQKQVEYGHDDGKYYSLLMGREFKPGRWCILLDFDNKADETSRNGMELAAKLNLDQYKGPKQLTPSGGLHYIFYVDAAQRENLGCSRNTILHEGVKYNMDVKFTNQLCNCAPSKIEGYGEYKWVKASRLLDIPKLPDNVYDMIRNKPPPLMTTPKPTATPSTLTPRSEAPSSTSAPSLPSLPSLPSGPAQATADELHDMEILCDCLSKEQLDNRQTWISLGMRLKKLGAPLGLWEKTSRKSPKFRPGECSRIWAAMHPNREFKISGLAALAKEGNLEKYNLVLPTLKTFAQVAPQQDATQFRPVVIDTPYLLLKGEGEASEAQKTFKEQTDNYMTGEGAKCLAIRSRYGSGKTYFLQRAIREHGLQRVLFITYRQSLARDIMRNFGALGFKNYLDAPDDPGVWNSPKLIVQLDSLLNVMLKNDQFACEGRFDLNYDMIVLDESESLLSHMDEKTMEGKEIQIFNLFDELLKHSKRVVFLDGDMSNRSLDFARSYGELAYIKNTNKDGGKVLNIIQTEAQWNEQLYTDLDKYYSEDPSFRVCIASQSSTRAVALVKEIREARPDLTVRCLVGTDSGETKRTVMEDINETLEGVNIFIYSPVIESGVDITVPVKKVFGVLCGRSNSQRAYLQMLARCRNVEESRIDIQHDPMLRINNNYNFWTYQEVMELNKESVQNTSLDFLVEGDYMGLGDNERNTRRKSISVHNTMERLNKNPSVFLNYLQTLALGKGMGFQITEKPAEEGAEGGGGGSGGGKTKNYRVSAILEAPDINQQEYEELEGRKKHGKTTTEENYKHEKHFWQRFLVMPQLDEGVLKDFMFNRNLFGNFLSLVDLKNFSKEDNLRSAKLQEAVGLVRELLFGLGWGSVVDVGTVMEREAFATNFVCNIVENESFRNQKRINEVFDLRKSTKIHGNMETKQILLWVNALVNPFGLKVGAVDKHGGGYKLEVCSDILGLIKRKNRRGKFYEDSENLLKQETPGGDPFIDEVGETILVKRERARVREMQEYDTRLLDRGVGGEEE